MKMIEVGEDSHPEVTIKMVVVWEDSHFEVIMKMVDVAEDSHPEMIMNKFFGKEGLTSRGDHEDGRGR
jgi:hypothetical protein